MQKILTLIITGAIIYMIFQQNVKSIAPPAHLKPQTESEKIADSPEGGTELSGSFFNKSNESP